MDVENEGQDLEKPGRELLPREQRFVDEYLVDLNATRAAKAAGYSEKTAYSQGSRLLKRVEVERAVRAGMHARAVKTGIQAEAVLTGLAGIAYVDVTDAVQYELNEPKDLAKLPEHLRRCVAGWEWDRNNNFVVRWRDNVRPLEDLGRHLGLFKERVEVTGGETVAARLRAARERAKAKKSPAS